VVHHYLGRRPQGGTNLFPIAFSGVVGEAEPVSIEIADTASERMKLARPVELTYALETRDGALTFGMPRSITDLPDDLASESIRASLLNVFSSIGSAAILVGADGEIGLMNAGAEALLGDGVRVQGGRLRPTRATNRSALERLIANATGGTAGKVELDPIALERETGGPLIVQAVPVAAAVAGRPSALILLNDPARTTSVSPRAALQLLGLTPAEARIASVVGAGRSPREAADELQLTFHTVRSGLRIIFDKLSISRQSELAKIVQRLAG
jgi:DNA-binding CsgD family transcriptional regulator